MVETSAPGLTMDSESSGAYARHRLEQLCERLRRLRPKVLDDRDPEPLHQYRVSLRRLRSLLIQFAPALLLPAKVTPSRIALLARATGATRDLDVLGLRLQHDLLPALPEIQRHTCDVLLLRRLSERRRKAFALLEAELTASRHQRLLERLRAWCAQPRFTPLGQQPLQPWIREWTLSITGSCFLHSGWFAEEPDAADLHDLRKRLKAVRYGLELLQEPLGAAAALWLQRWRRAQACLGDLQDLAVQRQWLERELRGELREAASSLHNLLTTERQVAWQGWLELRCELLDPACRRSLLNLDGTRD